MALIKNGWRSKSLLMVLESSATDRTNRAKHDSHICTPSALSAGSSDPESVEGERA